MKVDERPIGVFDSGVGGLAVVAEVRKLLPHEEIVYLADSAHFPYGPRHREEICQLATEATTFLLDQGAKVVVVACNTATSTAIAQLRQLNPEIPFVGMVPPVKPAAAATRNGRIAVLATEGTVHSQALADLIAQFAQGKQVYTDIAPELVDAVERGDLKSPRVRSTVQRRLEPLLAQGIDTLALGCSHYSFLLPLMVEVTGPEVAVIDASAPVARQVARILAERGLANQDHREGSVTYVTSGDEEAFLRTMARLREQGYDL